MKIAFFDSKSYDIQSFSVQNASFGNKLKFFDTKLNEDSAKLVKGYDVVCAFVNDTLNKEVLETLSEQGIKLIAMRCAGYNNVDLDTAHTLNIPVVRVPAYSPYAVAEHALALIMTLNRKTHKAYNRTRENNFSINGLTGFDLNGKTIGIIGTGKIGQVFIKICLGLGLKVLAYDKYPVENLGITYVDLNRLYKEADIISLHCPLLPDTHHMINKESLEMMKEGVMLINTSRGALIDATALIEGLKSKKIGSAGLDVYEEESDFFFEDMSEDVVDDDILARLLSFNNVLITSHQAFLTKEALQNIAETTLESIQSFEKGEKLMQQICPKCPK